MALQKEIWQKDIVDNLYKDNEFATRCHRADEFVLSGKVVHIPVAGAAADVHKNMTNFPATAVKRTDGELTYALDTFYSTPRHIENIEKYELSYDKRDSIVGEDNKNLVETAMESLLYNWAPKGNNLLFTDGADQETDLLGGATGSRKEFKTTAFKEIAKKMSNENVGKKRVAMLTVNHYYQFINDLTDGEKTAFFAVADMKNGIVGRYMGFDILMRSSVLRYRYLSNAWTPVDTLAGEFISSTKTGDCAASLFWEESSVEAALGDVIVFDDSANPLYYGDVFSSELRMGGRIRRQAGVWAVIEAVGA